MKKGKIIRFVGVCGLALGALGAASAPILTTNHVATVSATSSVEDDSSARAITIHKYSTTDATKVTPNGTEDLPGAPSQDDTSNTPLPGISFKVEKVTKKAGADKFDASDPSTYDVDSSFTAQTVTTGDDGSVTANLGSGKAADGYYLVTEQPSEAVAKASAPFIVHIPLTVKDATTSDASLEYDVNVYPKNSLNDITTNPVKTINGGLAASVKSGAAVSWDLTIDRPADIHGSGLTDDGTSTSTTDDGNGGTTTTTTHKYTKYASELKLIDDLDDSYMKYDKIESVTIHSTGSGEATDSALKDGTDYKVTTTDADGKTRVTVELTADGIAKFADAPSGSTLDAKLSTIVTADSKAEVQNTFTTEYKGTATPNTDTETSNNPKNPNNPTVYFGNVDLTKTDEQNKPLKDATFTLYAKKASVTGEPKSMDDLTPVTSTKKDAQGNPEAVTVTTGADGKAEITGLQVDPTTKKQDYYLVETSAPVGYDVDGEIHKVTATQDKDNDATVVDHDNLIPNLPLTGSQGRILLYALTTGLIVIGATGVIVIKKRQRNA